VHLSRILFLPKICDLFLDKIPTCLTAGGPARRQAGFRTFAGASFGVCGFSFKATPVFWDLLGLAICL